MKRSILAVVVASFVAPMAHASNADVINYFNKVDTWANTHDFMPAINARQEAQNAFANLNARDRMVAAGIEDKTPHAGFSNQITSQSYNPANVPAGWDKWQTEKFIALSHGETEKAAAIEAAGRAAANPATEVQNSEVESIEVVKVDPLTFIQPAPVAPAPVITESEQTKSIRENLAQAKTAYLQQSDKNSPVGVAMRDTMTSLQQQLKQSQQADQFKPLADEVKAANMKAGYAAAQAKPASYDAPANAEQADREQSQAVAAQPATYDAPAGAEQADKVAEQTAEKTAQAKQEAAEGQAKADALATGPKAQRMLEARQDAQIAALEKVTAEPVKTAATVETNKAPVETKTEPTKAQVVNHYTVNGMTAKQAAQQQDNTDQIIAHSRSIAANRDAITSLENSTNKRFADIDKRVDENRKHANAGISGAMAQANIPQVTESQRFAVGAGVGGYDGENALAVGVSFHATQNVVVKATVSDDSAHNVGYGAGVAWGF
ncbi:YadA-like family protein [Salmonella enterica]|nr:YadA-like family protein [Salmonella enterica]